jgi:pyruvate,water dikinase
MGQQIVWFDDPEGDRHDLVGGKGANLGRLTKAGFDVPPGMTVSTAGYAATLRAAGLDVRIAELVTHLDYQDADDLERRTAEIRTLIEGVTLPAELARDLAQGYEHMGRPLVAVRSSGTAEDLAEASFAGLHDTYLEIQGIDHLEHALKGCWASLWTARATSYRNRNGFDSPDVSIAVVVQQMVDSSVSGVMFTGNPMTADSGEIVINASWGLGEAVVQGLITPDTFCVRTADLVIRERTLGEKALKIVRDSAAGSGTVTIPVGDSDRSASTLTDGQIKDLANLGRRVADYYGQLPQDIEWAFAGGELYLLQSRPITGVEFSWDEEVDAWMVGANLADDDKYTWTREWSDSDWTGAKTPLFYSHRSYTVNRGHIFAAKQWGFEDLVKMRYFKYHKGEAYYNCDLDQGVVQRTAFPMFRDNMLAYIPPPWHGEVMSEPLSIANWVKMQARIALLGGKHAHHNWWAVLEKKYIKSPRWDLSNLPDLGKLSDRELRKYTEQYIEWEAEYCEDVWIGFLQHCRDAIWLLRYMTTNWYTGSNEMVFADLVSGSVQRSATLRENLDLWGLAVSISKSEYLTKTFEGNEGAAFFSALEGNTEGEEFLKGYRAFFDTAFWRGHADRDTIFPRRGDDISIDYRNLRAMLNGDLSVSPEVMEEETNARRERAVEDVIANLRNKPLGALRVEAFRVVLGYVHRFIFQRDDERWSLDRLTYGTKLLFNELGRRVKAKGLIESNDDYFFLSKDELWAYYETGANRKLVQAKIAGRKANWERHYRKEADLPPYLREGRGVDFRGDAEAVDGVFKGTGTSRGTVTGTVRVVKEVDQIGLVKAGEILICNSTDPGWTPVFAVISGIITETGGLLSHASCLSREYGLPAVQLTKAMKLISDGATVTINGDTGTVAVIDVELDAELPVAEVAVPA